MTRPRRWFAVGAIVMYWSVVPAAFIAYPEASFTEFMHLVLSTQVSITLSLWAYSGIKRWFTACTDSSRL